MATMARALLYLRVTSVVGQVRTRVARLKQPKYLGGAVVGAAYLYMTFIRRLLGGHVGYGPGIHTVGLPPEVSDMLPWLGALILLAVLLVNWALPRSASLAFSEPEIAFLFPAPVTRRMLVHYRLLSSQLGIVFTALILTVVFGRRGGLGGNLWFHAIGWWLILATLNLHFTGTSFVYSRILNPSLTSARSRAISLGAIWLALCALVAWLCHVARMPLPADMDSVHDFAGYVGTQLAMAPFPWLLALPKVVVAPYFAGSGGAFVMALGWGLVVLVAHYFWVLNIEVAFEEASIARAQKRAARRKAIQQGDWRGQTAARSAQKPVFKLSPGGRPELAFLWKNLLSASSIFRPKVALVLILLIVAGSLWLTRHPDADGIRIFVLTMAGLVLGMTLFFGPMMARQDLRSDLSNADLLKTYPLQGWQIVLGELLTPISILTVVIWMCLLAGALLLTGGDPLIASPWTRGAAAVGLALIAVPLVTIQLVVPNTAAVLFPAWMQTAANRGERGIEVMGQRLIFMAGQLLITAIAMVPAGVCAALVFFAALWLIGVVTAAVLAVAMTVLVLTVEAGLGVYWLGERFERFDYSAELKP